MKLRLDEKDYGYDSNGEAISESTVEELYRVANTEVLPFTELATIGDAEIDEDSFEFYNTGTAYGANLIYNIILNTDSDRLDLEYFMTENNVLCPIFDNDHSSARLSFVIHVFDGTKIEIKLTDNDVYDSGNFYSEYDTNNFKKYIDVKALKEYVANIAQKSVKEIQATLSNI